MPPVRSVAVFCGSRLGLEPVFRDAGSALGRGLAKAGLRLIYGGGRVGLMGVIADAVLAEGGEVVGVIPDFLQAREVAHPGIGTLEVTDSMHSRKRRMFALADAFVCFPGGLGTLDETFEILTWRQLGLHDKPILICDVAGWADTLMAMLETIIAAGFATPATRDLYELTPGVDAALRRLCQLVGAPGGASALL